MQLATLYSSAVQGVNAYTVAIEVHVTPGAGTQEVKYFIVGLPDNAVRESLQRVDVAIKQSGFFMPRNRIVVNLSPADVRKEGTAYDLPIALGILASSEQLIDIRFKDFYTPRRVISRWNY